MKKLYTVKLTNLFSGRDYIYKTISTTEHGAKCKVIREYNIPSHWAKTEILEIYNIEKGFNE